MPKSLREGLLDRLYDLKNSKGEFPPDSELVDAILSVIKKALPEKEILLNLQADIPNVNEYVRHKERVNGRNAAIEEMEDLLK